MHIVPILIVLAVVGIVMLSAGCKKSEQNPVPPKKATGTTSNGAFLSRDEIQAKLRQISASKEPTDLSPGAMCYEVAAPPDRVEYVCPACSQKTLYTSNNMGLTWLIDRELIIIRRAAKQIAGINARVDETQFCKACSGKEIKQPAPILVVKLAGRPEHTCEGVRFEDIMLIRAFVEGKDRYKGDTDNEISVKSKMKRLEALLGIAAGE